MAINRGKDFEDVIKDDLLKINDVLGRIVIDVQRLYDTTNGFAGIKQPSDFSVYMHPYHYYLECKSTHEHTLNKAKITQMDKLREKDKVEGVRVGVFIWFEEDDLTVYVPIATLVNHFYNRDKKSVAVKDILSGDFDNSGWYYILKGRKKRIYWEYDMLDFFENYIGKEVN